MADHPVVDSFIRAAIAVAKPVHRFRHSAAVSKHDSSALLHFVVSFPPCAACTPKVDCLRLALMALVVFKNCLRFLPLLFYYREL